MTAPAPRTAPDEIWKTLVDTYTDYEGLGTIEAFTVAANATYTAVLTAAYWKIRQHADGYRDANAYQRAQERAKTGSDSDRRVAAVHRSYASGIDAAARTVADMLGIPEHEIEPAQP